MKHFGTLSIIKSHIKTKQKTKKILFIFVYIQNELCEIQEFKQRKFFAYCGHYGKPNNDIDHGLRSMIVSVFVSVSFNFGTFGRKRKRHSS